MKTYKLNFFKKFQGYFILIAFLSIQVAGAIELCMCHLNQTPSAIHRLEKQNLPACHAQEEPLPLGQSEQKHDHHSCDCKIEVPSDPQEITALSEFDFQKFTHLYNLTQPHSRNFPDYTIAFNSRPPSHSSPPIYKITQHYLN